MFEKGPELMEERLFYARLFAILVLAGLGYLLFQVVVPFLAPIAWAGIIAFLLFPLWRYLPQALKARRTLSSMLLLLAATVFVIVPIAFILAAFAAQAANLLRDLQAATSGGSISLRIEDAPLLGVIAAWAEENAGISAAQLQQWIGEALRQGLQFLMGLSGKLFLGAVNTVLAFTIMLVVLFFFLRDGDTIITALKSFAPLSRDKTDKLFANAGDAMHAVVFGTVLTALVQGALVGFAFAMLDLPAPVVFGAVSALFALLPVGGPAIIWLPAALILAADDRWWAAIGLTAWGLLLVATIDNFLRPLIVSSRAEVSALTVFIGVLGGAAAFGMVGLLVGPVILALCLAVLRFTLESR